MAVATVQSVSTTAWGLRSSITLTKPTGTVDGDLLVAVVASQPGSAPDSVPSGWTERHVASSAVLGYVYTKIASSEGASWDWGIAGTNEACAGVVLRIDGHDPTSYWDTSAEAAVSNSATPSFANTITPASTSQLLIFVIVAKETGDAATVGSYAIATDNPTWTERADLLYEANDYLVAVATAPRTSANATGNSSCAIGAATTDSEGVMISILSNPNVTVTPSVIDMTFSIQAIASITGGAVASPAVITITASIQAPTVTLTPAKWSNTDKNSASWNNLDKS